MLKSTKQHSTYWKNRKIDWKQAYLSTWNHPHRRLITWILESIPFVSLWEVGCGPGPNLMRIVKDLPNKQLGGSDVSEEAIAVARETFANALFHVERGNNLLMSDGSVDIILTDMTLIYVDPFEIDSYLREFKRVARMYVVLVEFHSKSWWKRQVARIGGYHVYDYQKRLEKIGFHSILIQRIPPDFWPGTDNNTEFRHIITARV